MILDDINICSNIIQYHWIISKPNDIGICVSLDFNNPIMAAAPGRPQSRCWTSIADELHRLARMDHRPLERCPRPGLGHHVARNDSWHLGKPDQMEVDAEKLHLELVCAKRYYNTDISNMNVQETNMNNMNNIEYIIENSVNITFFEGGV